MNQSLERRNLNDTTGISLVILVNNNHSKLINMTMDKGCFNIRKSYLLSYNIQIRKNTNTPSINGSVGREIPIPRSKSRILTARWYRGFQCQYKGSFETEGKY